MLRSRERDPGRARDEVIGGVRAPSASSPRARTGTGHSVLVVPVPEAERVVGSHRFRLDPRASVGRRAFVTVLAPFLPTDALTPQVLADVGGALAEVPAFDCVFDQTRWFDEDCLWLAVVPEDGFTGLTRRVRAAFPDLEPYAGRRPEVPHLTVGFRSTSSVWDLRIAAARLGGQLPIAARVREVQLFTLEPGDRRWDVHTTFPLADPGA